MRALRALLSAFGAVGASGAVAATLLVVLLWVSAAAGSGDSGVAAVDGGRAPVTDAGAPPVAAGFDDDHLDAWCQRRLLAPFRALSDDGTGAWDEIDPSILNPGPLFDQQREALWTRVEAMLGETERKTAVVVALVPDAIDTGYVYQFYEASSAIEVGIEQMGYLRDEAWLPWDDSHLQKKESRPLSESCRLRVPGALILRDAAESTEAKGARPRWIVTLFVGETPTEGIHKATFGKALALARRLETWRVGHLRIVGPTYSGSADSLRASLDAEELDAGRAGDASTRATSASDAGTSPSTSIVSGSATKSAIDSVLTRDAVAPPMRFRRTTLDNESSESLFFRWLRGRGIGVGHPERVGLLVEEGTLFGREPAAPPAGAASATAQAAVSAAPSVTLHFRRGIADLQRAHELQDANARAQSQSTPTSIVTPPSSVLDPSFDERTTPRDTAPDPSPKRLAALDLELRNLLSEVSREGLTYLAIRATDSGDAVFLAQQVHASAPDVRLIFMAGDVLLLHPAFASDFRGSLLVSPYPFFGTSDLSNSGSSRAHDHFPWESESAEGIFNAAIAVLAPDVPLPPVGDGQDGGGQDGEGPEERAQRLLLLMSEYAPLSSTDGGPDGCQGQEPLLPLWVAVIGNGTVFPIDVLVPEASGLPARGLFNPCKVYSPPSGGSPSGDRDARQSSPPGAWTLRIDASMRLPNGWTLLLLICGVAGVTEYLFSRRTLKRRVEGALPLLDVNPVRRPDLVLLYGTQLRYAAARSVAVAMVFGYMTTVNFLALRSKPFDSDVAAWRWVAMVGWMVLTWLLTAALASFAAGRLVQSIRADWKVYGALDALRERWPNGARPKPEGQAQEAVDPVTEMWRVVQGDAPGVENARTLHVLHASGLYSLIVVVVFIGTWRAVLDLPTFLGPDLRPTASGVAFVLRSLPLASGVSAAVVVVFLGVALLIWVAGRVQRAELTRGLSLITPHPGDTVGVADAADEVPPALVSTPVAYVTSNAELVAIEARVQNVLQRPAALPYSLLRSVVIVVLPVVAFFLKPPTSLETGGDTLALVVLLCVITLIVGLTAQHFLEFWLALRAMLDALRRWGGSSIFPLATGTVGAPVSRLVTGRHKNVELDELLLCAEVAKRVANAPGYDKVVEARAAMEASTDDQVLGGRDLGRALLELGRSLCATGPGVAQSTLMHALPVDGDDERGAKKSEPPPDAEFVACVVCHLLNRYVRHARDFMTATSTPAVFIVLVLAFYPFEPHRLLMTYAWVLTLSVVGAGVIVLLGMQRNVVLGSFAGGSTGRLKVSRDSVVHFVAWVLIPLVSVFAAQFPEFGHLIGAVLDPISSAFR